MSFSCRAVVYIRAVCSKSNALTLGGQSKAATYGQFKTGHFEGLRHSFGGGEFSLCQHGQCLEQREAGTGDSVGAAGLAPSADRGGDGSASRDGGRLPAVSRYLGSLAGDLGTEVSFKSGHFSDHRLFGFKPGQQFKTGHRSDHRLFRRIRASGSGWPAFFMQQ